ncbi:MAG: hypothetical protein CMH41_05120 [Micrococcales bacterium]|nr:hypothetical protein [Micrococcales bacterium]
MKMYRVMAIGISAVLFAATMSFANIAQADPQNTNPVQVYLGLDRPEAALENFATQVSDPANKMYGKYLSLADAASQFGADPETIANAKSWLNDNNYSTIKLHPTGTTLIAEMSQTDAKRDFCWNSDEPYAQKLCIPSGLSQYVTAAMVVLQGTDVPPPPSSSPTQNRALGTADPINNGTPSGCDGAKNTGAYTPNQYLTSYGVTDLHDSGFSGKGMRIAILVDRKYNDQDLEVFAQCFGYSTSNVHQQQLWSYSQPVQEVLPFEEQWMDVELVLATAPDAERITTLEFTTNYAQYQVEALAGVLDPSNMGGTLPHVVTTSEDQRYSNFAPYQRELATTYAQLLAALGITMVQASGDEGFSSDDQVFPASSGWVTAVGGTQLDLNKANQRTNEVAWEDSSGGPQNQVPRPAWQRGVGNKGQPQNRLSPDVALVASDDEPGLAFYAPDVEDNRSKWLATGGGTSAAAPIFAGMLTLFNQRLLEQNRTQLGFINPMIYSMANGSEYNALFYDVTKNQRGSAPTPALVGYDMATGWGVPVANKMSDWLTGNVSRDKCVQNAAPPSRATDPAAMHPGKVSAIKVKKIKSSKKKGTRHRVVVSPPLDTGTSPVRSYCLRFKGQVVGKDQSPEWKKWLTIRVPQPAVGTKQKITKTIRNFDRFSKASIRKAEVYAQHEFGSGARKVRKLGKTVFGLG